MGTQLHKLLRSEYRGIFSRTSGFGDPPGEKMGNSPSQTPREGEHADSLYAPPLLIAKLLEERRTPCKLSNKSEREAARPPEKRTGVKTPYLASPRRAPCFLRHIPAGEIGGAQKRCSVLGPTIASRANLLEASTMSNVEVAAQLGCAQSLTRH